MTDGETVHVIDYLKPEVREEARFIKINDGESLLELKKRDEARMQEEVLAKVRELIEKNNTLLMAEFIDLLNKSLRN